MSMRIGYALGEIAENWRRSGWWRGRINDRINGPVQRRIAGGSTIRILEEEWDVLVVADACRADLFAEGADESRFDSYTTTTSPASTTPEWLRENFTETYGDIVYVAANPMVSLHKPTVFHELIESWRRHIDTETGIVPAPKVTEDAIEALDEHPDKRVVVHYMQPHFPFVRDADLQFAQWRIFTDEFEEFDEKTGGRRADVSDIWGAQEAGLVDRAEVWPAYRRNLEYVMESVESLLASTDRRVVVTSDHGNLAGERMWPVPIRGYGHPGGLRQSELTEVPLGVVEATGDRPEVVAGPVRSHTGADEETISDRLESLGYA